MLLLIKTAQNTLAEIMKTKNIYNNFVEILSLYKILQYFSC